MKLPIQAQPVNRKVNDAKITGGSIFPSAIITQWDKCGRKLTYDPSKETIVPDPRNPRCAMVVFITTPVVIDVQPGSFRP